MIFSATHTGDYEFKLDKVPLHGTGEVVWSKGKVVWCVGRMRGESEGGARLIRRVGLTAGP